MLGQTNNNWLVDKVSRHKVSRHQLVEKETELGNKQDSTRFYRILQD